MTQPPPRQFSGIFISYRREDSGGHAGRLYDRLAAHFGDEQVWMDMDRIEPGEDFVQFIEDAVGSCDVLLAVIGRRWLSAGDDGTRRLDSPNDFVRLEIAAALDRDIRVIPVLVQGVAMPVLQDLPDNLSRLSRRQAHHLSDLRWHYDVNGLIAALEKVLSRRREERLQAEQAKELERQEAERRRAGEEVRRQREAEEAERQRREVEEAERQKREAAIAARQRAEAEKDEAGRAADSKPARPAAAHESPSATALSPRSQVRTARRVRPVVAAAFVLALLFAADALISKLPRGTSEGRTTPDPTASPSLTAAQPYPEQQTKGAPEAPSRMVFVPGGEFVMGSAAGDEFERPAHKRTVAPFFIDLYEVTNEEYARFVRERNHPPPATWQGGQYPAGAAQQPVTGVNWDDANAFCRDLGKRLPREEEWEFAARGKDGRRYPWGNEWKAGLANAGSGSAGGLADVGTFKGASPFGVFDMTGNAWEWTASDLVAYEGGHLPDDVTGLKVIRGGYWGSSPPKATATFRRGWPPQGEEYSNMSFRCAMDVGK